jgi:hypothetical protein
MHFYQITLFGKLLQVAAYGIFRYFEPLTQIAAQHFVVHVYLLHDVCLPFLF